MTRHLPRRRPPIDFTTLALLSSTLLSRPAGADESPSVEFPAGIVDGYAALAKSILDEDMPGFMKLFESEFLFEGIDGAGLDRGPWRRLWLERFSLRRYERLAYEPVEITEEEDARVALRARYVAVYRDEATGTRRLEEMTVDDTWTRVSDAWQLVARIETEAGASGALVGAGASDPSSPAIAGLAATLDDDDRADLATFWHGVRQTGVPLVEEIPGDALHRRVTFLWRAEGRETAVTLRGGLPAAGAKPLEQLGDTDLWFRSEILPRDARATYEFIVESAIPVRAFAGKSARIATIESVRTDPLNRGAVDGSSLLDLAPGSTVAPTEAVDGRPEGEVERYTIDSAVLGERRFVTVYTPPDYGTLESPARPLFLVDESSYRSRRVGGVVLDNLIAEGKIAPCVAFFIHSEGSMRPELEVSPAMMRFVAEELVPWARGKFRVEATGERAVIGGSGKGATLAALIAVHHPDVARHVLVENADLSVCLPARPIDAGCLARLVAMLETRPLSVDVTVGSLESASVVSDAHHLRDVLDAKGYPSTFTVVPANRHATTWLDALARTLVALGR